MAPENEPEKPVPGAEQPTLPDPDAIPDDDDDDEEEDPGPDVGGSE